MKKLGVLLAIVFMCFSCKKEAKKQIADASVKKVKNYTIKQFMENEFVGGGSFSPDKSKLLVTSNRSGIYNMYTVPATGGEFTPITKSDSSSVFAISYFPNDDVCYLEWTVTAMKSTIYTSEKLMVI